MPVASPEVKRAFKFYMKGQYYGAHGETGLPVVKQYTAEFDLPSQESALSIICKHLLSPYLQNKYPDFVRFRTHWITSMETSGRKPNPEVLQMPIEEMNISQLSDFCLLKQIFIDPYKHSDLPLCREQVMRVYHDRLNQAKANQENGEGERIKEVNALLELNNLPKIPKDGFVPVSLNEQRVASALAGAKAAGAVVGPQEIVPAEDEGSGELPPLEPEVEPPAGDDIFK